MANIKLYFHTGSSNHGCEAIVRGTHKILNHDLELFSFSPEEDRKYKIDELVSLEADSDVALKHWSIKYFISALQIKLFGKTTLNTRFRHKQLFNNIKRGDICLSIGGDNYTYQGVDQLADYNKIIHSKGAKTVLWCCSIDEHLVKSLIDDLNRYDMIVARESMTIDALKAVGIKTRLRICSDPAFQLDIAEVVLPKGFEKSQTVGINMSPLILMYENRDLILQNYENLIRYIIENTNLQVAFVPHVLKPKSNDRNVLMPFYKLFESSGRIIILDDQNCMELKGYISQCRFFIGARTHSTIAAYSTSVPTVVVGYSMKAKGIAKDIFGTYENYVCPVQNLSGENELTDAFCWLQENENLILNHYEKVMPAYRASALNGADYIKEIINGI